MRCARCKLVRYCNREHQVADWATHRGICNRIAESKRLVDKEETELREKPADLALPEDVFTNGVGHFWGILDTRDYMRARDNMGVRDMVPSLMLRLDKDQECYDFVKWWKTEPPRYDWADLEQPYMNIKDAGAFELVDYMCTTYIDLSHTVSITLLKIKLLLDLMSMAGSALLGHQFPVEIVRKIQEAGVRSPIVLKNWAALEGDALLPKINELIGQVNALYQHVDKNNEHFWPALMEPGRHLTARPEYMSDGSVEEMQNVLQQTYDAWLETPGALDMIKARVPLQAT
ncbi:hypothetical protein BC832DRAFT_622718 [Gaertneriomyces semiglobifer]|nr:hypothetical protein BC832DRAFT_622718 [Gaertneriomyces semiglobifer]